MVKFQRNRAHMPPNSVDGMLAPANRSSGQQPQSVPGKSTQPIQAPSDRSRLDDFRGSDGFRPSGQPLIRGSEHRQPGRSGGGFIDLSLPPAPNKPKKHRNWKKLSIRSGAGLLIVTLMVGGFLFGKGYLKLHQIFKGGAEGAA